MITFFNKHKRFLYLIILLLIILLMCFPTLPKEMVVSKIGTLIFYYSGDYNTVFPCAFLLIFADIMLSIGLINIFAYLVLLLLNKKPRILSSPFVFLLIPTCIKVDLLLSTTNYYIPYLAPDYIIISIALLMLIVDIVRLSLYIRAHKDAIHAKAADISARLKTKLQREHKPTKDERIAELEERVKQLEDKQDE